MRGVQVPSSAELPQNILAHRTSIARIPPPAPLIRCERRKTPDFLPERETWRRRTYFTSTIFSLTISPFLMVLPMRSLKSAMVKSTMGSTS